MDLSDLSSVTSRQHLPNNSDDLKDLILSLLEAIDYLKSEIVILKRFHYGQRSERKKKV